MAFNQLSDAELERLYILDEESNEIGKCCCKIERHGFESNNKGLLPETNRQALERELGDFLHAMHRMCKAGDIDFTKIIERATSEDRTKYVKQYLHHNEE